MGPGGMQPQGMVNMTPPLGGAMGHMQSHATHVHMRPNLMMHRANPRPTLPNPMATGVNAQIIVPGSNNPNHTSTSPQPPSNPSVSLGGGNNPAISGITPTVSGGGEMGGVGMTNSTSMGGGVGTSGVSRFAGNFQASSVRREPQNPPGGMCTSDPEKRKQIQQQLVLLLHAHKCQRREQDMQVSGDYTPCSLPHCKTMKNVLNHMAICQAGRNCPYPHCASSRQIITHWKNCTRADCPVCLPLKHASMPRKPGGGGGGVSGGGGTAGSGAGPIGQPRDGFPSNPNQVMMNPPQEVSRQMVPPPHSGAGGGVAGGGMPDYPNLVNSQVSSSTHTIPIPSISSVPTKHWHNEVVPDLRQQLVRKLVEGIYPVNDPVALQDKRVCSLIEYAMKVEKAMFDMASSRENYYKLLAQKICNIRKELEDRKKIKKSSPQPGQAVMQVPQQAQQPQPAYSGSSGYPMPLTVFSSASSATGNSSTATTSSMVNSPIPPPTSEMNPGSVGLPAISSPLSMLDSKKDILSKLVSSPSSGYQLVSYASQNSDRLLQPGGIPSLSSFKIEPMDEPIKGTGGGGLPSLPSIKIEPKEESMSAGSSSSNNIDSNNMDSNAPTATPVNAKSPPPQPNLQPQPVQSSVPSSSEINPGSCTISSPLDSKKDIYASNPPSERNSDPLSQECGVPSLSVPKSSPLAEEERAKKISPVPSLRKDGFPSNPNFPQEVSRQMVPPPHSGAGGGVAGGGMPDYPNLVNPQVPSSTLTIHIPSISSVPTKHWHNEIVPDLRQRIVGKLVEAIYPVHDPVALQDMRVYSLIQYAMKVEEAVFHMASSRENYYKLLARKIRNIKEKKKDRKKIKKSSPQPGQEVMQVPQQAQQPQPAYSGSSGYPMPLTVFSSASPAT